MLTWLKKNWANLAQAVGGIATAGALVLAYFPLVETKRALRANTVYNIQKDGRDLLTALIADEGVYLYIYNHDSDKKYAIDVQIKAGLRIRQLINFYAAAFNQWKAGAIDDEFWKTTHQDLCVLLKQEPAQQIWNQIKKNPTAYQSSFVKAGDTCQKEP